MRYQSEEENRLLEIYRPYLEHDDRGFSYLPDTAPQEAQEAYEKVQQMIFDREKKECGFF